jgi:hypothetical protein
MNSNRSTLQNLSETRFEWLLTQRSFLFVEENNLEQKIVVKGKRPDYYAWKGETAILAEIKEFNDAGPFDSSQRLGSGQVDDIINRFREPLSTAADQLKPYKELELAGIVVFDNHQRVGFPNRPLELIQLFGTIRRRIIYNKKNGHAEDQGWHHGPRQILTPVRRKYISAIAVNLPKAGNEYIEQSNIERPMRLQIVHNPYAANPLDKKLFDDPEDEHYELFMGQWVNCITKKPLMIS